MVGATAVPLADRGSRLASRSARIRCGGALGDADPVRELPDAAVAVAGEADRGRGRGWTGTSRRSVRMAVGGCSGGIGHTIPDAMAGVAQAGHPVPVPGSRTRSSRWAPAVRPRPDAGEALDAPSIAPSLPFSNGIALWPLWPLSSRPSPTTRRVHYGAPATFQPNVDRRAQAQAGVHVQATRTTAEPATTNCVSRRCVLRHRIQTRMRPSTGRYVGFRQTIERDVAAAQ